MLEIREVGLIQELLGPVRRRYRKVGSFQQIDTHREPSGPGAVGWCIPVIRVDVERMARREAKREARHPGIKGAAISKAELIDLRMDLQPSFQIEKILSPIEVAVDQVL